MTQQVLTSTRLPSAFAPSTASPRVSVQARTSQSLLTSPSAHTQPHADPSGSTFSTSGTERFSLLTCHQVSAAPASCCRQCKAPTRSPCLCSVCSYPEQPKRPADTHLPPSPFSGRSPHLPVTLASTLHPSPDLRGTARPRGHTPLPCPSVHHSNTTFPAGASPNPYLELHTLALPGSLPRFPLLTAPSTCDTDILVTPGSLSVQSEL